MNLSSLNDTLCDFSNVRNVIQFVVENKQIKLSDYVRKVLRDKKLSYRDVANASGGLIRHNAVSDCVNNDTRNFTVQTLQGLARGLDESEDIIFNLARGLPINSGMIVNARFAAIAEGYEGVSEQVKENLEPFISAIELTIKANTKPRKGESKPKVLPKFEESYLEQKK